MGPSARPAPTAAGGSSTKRDVWSATDVAIASASRGSFNNMEGVPLGRGRKEKVTKVIDGDTIETGSRKNPVRLANVNAPEKGQPGAAKAKERLEKLIGGEEVRIETVARDKYGRSVARVYKGRESVNKKMRESLKKK